MKKQMDQVEHQLGQLESKMSTNELSIYSMDDYINQVLRALFSFLFFVLFPYRSGL